MKKIERIRVFVSDENGVLAVDNEGNRMEIEPYGFRRLYQPYEGIITLGDSRTARVRGKKKHFCRKPKADEDLIAIISTFGGKPYVVKWNFAKVYDDLVQKPTVVSYESAGAAAGA